MARRSRPWLRRATCPANVPHSVTSLPHPALQVRTLCHTTPRPRRPMRALRPWRCGEMRLTSCERKRSSATPLGTLRSPPKAAHRCVWHLVCARRLQVTEISWDDCAGSVFRPSDIVFAYPNYSGGEHITSLCMHAGLCSSCDNSCCGQEPCTENPLAFPSLPAHFKRPPTHRGRNGERARVASRGWPAAFPVLRRLRPPRPPPR